MPCLHASPTPGCCLRQGSDHRPVHPCLCLSSLCLTACASPTVPTLTGLWFKQTRRAQLTAHLPVFLPLLPLQPVPEAEIQVAPWLHLIVQTENKERNRDFFSSPSLLPREVWTPTLRQQEAMDHHLGNGCNFLSI